MSKMLLWEKIDLPFMLTMDRKSWQLCAIPPLACSAVLVFLPSLLVCATTLVIPMLLYKSYPSLLVRMHKPCKWVAGAFTRCTSWRGNDPLKGWEEDQEFHQSLLEQYKSSM